MLPPVQPLWKREGFTSTACIACAFWVLAIVVLVNMHWLHLRGMPIVRPFGYTVILVCCLLVLGLAGARWRRVPGTPGVLFAAAIISYLVIGVSVLLATEPEWQPDMGKDILRQVFFFIVFLAAMFGGRAMLAQIGVEALLKRMLLILIASCIVVLASRFLRDWGILSAYRLPLRLTGAFTGPNDAGFVCGMTTALALAFLLNGGPRKLAYSGLAVGYAAVLGSLSKTAMLAFCTLLVFFLLSNSLGRRHPVLRWLLVPSMIGIVVHSSGHLSKIVLYTDNSRDSFCSTVSLDNPGLGGDCTLLLAARDALAGDAALNWNDSTPIALWQGVTLEGAPARVVALDLSRLELNGRIPPELSGLDQLVSLRLGGNRLTGPIPAELEALANSPLPHLAGDDLSVTGNEIVRAAPPVARETKTALGLEQLRSTGERMQAAKGEKAGYGFTGRRLHTWKTGLEKIRESPIIGNGIGSLRSMDDMPITADGRPTGVHNVYLLLAGEAGIAPLLLYLLSLFCMMRLHWTAPRSLARDAVFGWTIIIALFGVAFQHLLTMGASMFLAGLSCALATVSSRRPQVAQPHPEFRF